MQTSSPSTNVRRGSTRSTMWCSLPRASRYGSGRWNDSNGPTNDKSSWRYVRAPAMSPLPSAFWYAVTMSFAFAIYSRSFGSAGDPEPEEAPHPRDVHPRQDDLSASPHDLPRGSVEVVHADVVHAARDLLRLHRPDAPAPAAGRLEREVLAERELQRLETPREDFLQEPPGRGRIRARELGEGHRPVIRPSRRRFPFRHCLPRCISRREIDIHWIVYRCP